MKNIQGILKAKHILSMMLIGVLSLSLVSCDNDDDPVRSIEYTLNAVAVPDISGTATFTELEDGSTQVVVSLQNTPAGGSHPGHIHIGSAAVGGGIAISLTAVDGATGMSTTIITMQNDQTPISYEELLSFDGYINIHLSSNELGTIVAQGNIGSNVQ
ncbi:MAG: hypothetical protein ACJAVN_002562 [Roseivirga sp.]|jgi:hypothetical protein